MKKVHFVDCGLIDYADAWSMQEKLFAEVVERKLFNRNAGALDPVEQKHHLLFCEHPHVYTLGRTGDEKHLLIKEEELASHSASFYRNNRGGDITYHGPGQVVGYPILDLDCFFTDIHRYMRTLEEAIIRTLATYRIVGERYPGFTGVWLQPQDPLRARKICAMGVRCSRWVTMHGFAFNVNTDLSYFRHIVPCGIGDKPVTSLSKELGQDVDIEEVKKRLLLELAEVFEMDILKEI
ncbi:MAG: lipoyl(octanoyl) transferase LipB [Bacteroidota bacterium]